MRKNNRQIFVWIKLLKDGSFNFLLLSEISNLIAEQLANTDVLTGRQYWT